MHIRLALLGFALSGTLAACATPDESTDTAAKAAPSPVKSGSYRTGSRLPSIDNDGGSSSVGNASRDDYLDETRRTGSPMRGY
jgi:hypothetical protein